jgi:hypothetical protein
MHLFLILGSLWLLTSILSATVASLAIKGYRR